MYGLWVGIDVSKDVFSTAGINSGGKESFSKTYSMDSNGFEGLLKTIRFDCEDLSKVVVAMESTGCYHINLHILWPFSLTFNGGNFPALLDSLNFLPILK